VVRSATLAVTNLGGDAITLGEATLTGADTSSFSFDTLAGPLAAGETRTIAVRYAPRRAGDDKAQLHIRATDPAVPEATVALAGRGVRRTVEVVIDPKKLAFGQVDVGVTETLALTVSNPSGEAILLDAVISDSPEFVVAPVKLGSIPGGGSRQIDVTFRPAAKGQRSANITLEVADPDPRDVVVAASGRGKEKKR
jgi:HYDIN/CFA65/VesB-like, Ig-like domain